MLDSQETHQHAQGCSSMWWNCRDKTVTLVNREGLETWAFLFLCCTEVWFSLSPLMPSLWPSFPT